ncbi:MAG: Gfo/Idh/MocA family oxidoreductase [Geminicoccaceae bacterium]|nr:Gfo/Idh/MocA family oxidoreductase [Geminicoccaceae bacterium]MDW8370261.1 Gfo/Idh/MocA family oxidoreductase [Geminicoccaceae bacterium]
MSARRRIAIVGCGIGAQHLDALLLAQDLWEVRVLCDRDLGRAKAQAARVPGAEVSTSLEEVLAREDVDVVDICLPPALHVPAVRAALQAGKHVVCEKPLASSLAEIDAIAALARTTGRVVCPVYQYRFGNGLRKLWRLIEAGVPGRALVATVETHWDRGPAYYRVPWRGRKESELGGVLVSHAIHAHDLVTEILGPARRVHAFTATRVNCIETEDCAAACLEMADGALVTLSVTLGSAEEITRLRFCFAHLTVESALSPYRPSGEPWRFVPRDAETAAEVKTLLEDFRPGPEGFHGLFTELALSLEEGEEPPVTLADARRSIELATALYYAAATHEMVELPLRTSHPAYSGWLRWLPA